MTSRSDLEPSVDSDQLVCLHVPALRCPLVDGLTPRQQEVVAALWDGASNQQIAVRLRCSPNTIAKHLASIYQRLEVRSRFELLAELALHQPAQAIAKSGGGAVDAENARRGTRGDQSD